MPKAAPAAGAGSPVSGDHSNAMEIAAPVEEESLDAPLENPEELGSHREEPAETSDEDEGEVEVPTRLKGKPLAQVYREFSGLEQERSRLGNELGEARALLRQALETALKPNTGAKGASEDEPDPTDEDFDTNPRAAAEKLVAKKLKPLKEAVLSAEQRAAILEFNARRPGFQQEVATPQFQEWVQQSPYRTRMFQAAAKFDVEAADELFALWDEHKPSIEGAETSADKKKAAIKRVTTETGGAGKTAAGKSGKKIYKSSELARLYVTDRERYNEMAEEIRAAFAEGRVR